MYILVAKEERRKLEDLVRKDFYLEKSVRVGVEKGT